MEVSYICYITSISLGTFARQFRKAAIFLVKFIRHSICPHGTARFIVARFSWNFVLVMFTVICTFFFLNWRDSPPQWAMTSSFKRFLDHTQRRTTVGRTLLDEWSARRRELYLTTHYNHNRQTSMPSVGFEPTNSASERPKTYALDQAATGTGCNLSISSEFALKSDKNN